MTRLSHPSTTARGILSESDHPILPATKAYATAHFYKGFFENRDENPNAINRARNRLQSCALHVAHLGSNHSLFYALYREILDQFYFPFGFRLLGKPSRTAIQGER